MIGLNWFDVIYLVLIMMVVWVNWDRGVFLILADVIAWGIGLFIGFAVTINIATGLAWQIKIPLNMAELGVFFLVVVISVYLLRRGLVALMEKVQNQNLPGEWQRVFGGILSVIYAILLLVFLAFLVSQLDFLNGYLKVMSSSWFFQNVYKQIVDWMTIA